MEIKSQEVLYVQYESERIEYKSQMIDDIYKEVIAFCKHRRRRNLYWS